MEGRERISIHQLLSASSKRPLVGSSHVSQAEPKRQCTELSRSTQDYGSFSTSGYEISTWGAEDLPFTESTNTQVQSYPGFEMAGNVDSQYTAFGLRPDWDNDSDENGNLGFSTRDVESHCDYLSPYDPRFDFSTDTFMAEATFESTSQPWISPVYDDFFAPTNSQGVIGINDVQEVPQLPFLWDNDDTVCPQQEGMGSLEEVGMSETTLEDSTTPVSEASVSQSAETAFQTGGLGMLITASFNAQWFAEFYN
jgi:hypothetical protein